MLLWDARNDTQSRVVTRPRYDPRAKFSRATAGDRGHAVVRFSTTRRRVFLNFLGKRTTIRIRVRTAFGDEYLAPGDRCGRSIGRVTRRVFPRLFLRRKHVDGTSNDERGNKRIVRLLARVPRERYRFVIRRSHVYLFFFFSSPAVYIGDVLDNGAVSK